jgi:hypothetical protein
MSKKKFKDILEAAADDLYNKGFRDGVNSCKKISLVRVEEADSSFTHQIRLGADPQYYQYIEIPKAIISSVKVEG